MIVVGQQEEETGMLKLRHQGGEEEKGMLIADLISFLKEQEANRS
jgi:threonyl-tRNA synthetase